MNHEELVTNSHTNAPPPPDWRSWLFASHRNPRSIVVKHTWGKTQQARTLIFALQMLLFLGIPWLRWGERQAVLFDIGNRKFHLWGVTVWPQEFYLLTFLLIIFALTLFLATAVVGRLFCAVGCPHTTMTAIFMEIERRVQGDRMARLKLAKGPWNAEKIGKIGLTHALFVLLALILGFTFVSYFAGNREILASLMTGVPHSGVRIAWLFVAALVYGFAGHFREKICQVACPYGRFQSIMIDPNSLIVAYDVQRGEPRGKYRAGQVSEAKDCVDCGMCVQVCPAGIDIREGLQMECIACARCIDACDDVMTKIKRPTGLIRFGSLNTFAGKETTIIRPRVLVYAAVIALAVAGIATTLLTRPVVTAEVIRNRAALYREMPDGRIANLYTLRAINKSANPQGVHVRIAGVEHPEILMGSNPLTLRPESVESLTFSVLAPSKDLAPGVNRIQIQVWDPRSDRLFSQVDTTFITPGPR
jgi:cytochrome c oxidase accessory protein FixG